METFRAAQAKDIEELATKTIEKISGRARAKGPESTGDAVVKAIEDSRTALKTKQNQMYSEIDKLTESQVKRVPKEIEVPSSLVDASGNPLSMTKRVMEKTRVGGVQPSTKPLRAPAARLLREIQEQKQLMDPKLLADTETTLRAILDAPERVSYEAMAKSRSDLLALTRKLDEALPGKRAGAAKLLSSAMSDSMMAAAKSSGNKGLPEMIEAANSYTAEMHRMFEQALVKKSLDTGKTETISAMVRNGGLQEIRDIYKLLPAVTKQNLKANIVQDMLEKTMDKSGNINTKQFVSVFNKLGEPRAKEIFGSNYASVKEMADIFGKIKTGGSGEAAGLFNIGIVVEALVSPTSLARKVGIYGGVYGLAKAITNPAQSAKVLSVLSKAAHVAPYAATGAYAVAFPGKDEKQAKSLPPKDEKQAKSLPPIE
jgi:hypothetical protein